MTRKKKSTPQQKRQQVVDSQGWTHIIKGPNNKVTAQHAILASHRRPSSTNTGFTLETYLSKLHQHYIPRWRESSCFKKLEKVFEENVLSLARHVTTMNCVCLGLGSMTAGLETPGFELAALMSMLEMLGTRHEIHQVIFQDPIFNPLDREILASLGYIVLENPEAFSKINESTFVFAPHLEFSAYATALEGALPALCIANDIDEYLNAPRLSNESGKREDNVKICRRYIERVESVAMPEFERTPWCTSQRIYWAKTKNESAEEVIAAFEKFGLS